MTLNSLEVTKCCKNSFILFSFFYLQNFLIFTFIFLELFLNELAMVLRYMNRKHKNFDMMIERQHGFHESMTRMTT
jgi:hypothetical protein